MARSVIYFLLIMLVMVVPVSTVSAQEQGAGDVAEGISLDFKDVELSELIRVISEMTGQNFLFDENLKGKVTIISPRPMSQDEAYQVFLSVLNVKGFTVVPSGTVNKVVSLREAKENNLPTGVRRDISGEQYVTRLIPLQHVDAATVASNVLQPLVPKTSQVVAYTPSNTLIITDSAANIERLYRIIRQLDVATSSLAVEVIPLSYASATEVAKICTQFLSQGGTSVRRVKGNVQTADTARTQVIAYTRTNALVVMATAEDLATVRLLVDQLDKRPDKNQSSMHVYYLENADAEELAKTLNEIVTGVKRVPASAPQGAQQAKESLAAVTITADRATNALVLSATPEEYEVLRNIIEQLDIRRKQVFVEALILELSMDITSDLGVSLQGAGSYDGDGAVFGTSNLNSGSANLSSLSPPDGSTVPTLLSQSIEGILLGGLFNPVTVTGLDGNDVTVPALSALIDASKSDSDVNILSAPRLLTSDNEEAEIVVGANVPIITSRLTDTGGGDGLAQSVSIERQDVALTLRFTPQVTEGNLVRLNVFQELTDLAQTQLGNVNEVGPTLTKRLLRNSVLAENGRTVVLGGLIGTNVEERVSKVPLLGDIPLLGWLFKRKRVEESKTNLLVFI
ncbi:MAG: type II secretion system protein GspD, partial [Desulfuromonas sp.]